MGTDLVGLKPIYCPDERRICPVNVNEWVASQEVVCRRTYYSGVVGT